MTERNENKTCIDGVIAIILIFFYGVASLLIIAFVSDSNQVTVSYIISVLLYFIMFCILNVRKQSFANIGICLDVVPILYIGVVSMVLLTYGVISERSYIYTQWFYYLIVVAGLEELILRGFAYSRINTLLGNKIISIMILGSIDGLLHSLIPIIKNNHAVIEGINYIGGGVFGYLLFLVVYLYTGNILNSIILHASLDASKHIPMLLPISVFYIIIILVKKRYQRKESMENSQ